MLAEYKENCFIVADSIRFMAVDGELYLVGLEGVGCIQVTKDVYSRLVKALMHTQGSYLHDYTDEESDTFRKKTDLAMRLKEFKLPDIEITEKGEEQ